MICSLCLVSKPVLSFHLSSLGAYYHIERNVAIPLRLRHSTDVRRIESIQEELQQFFNPNEVIPEESNEQQ
jgi:hypothetical protein